MWLCVLSVKSTDPGLLFELKGVDAERCNQCNMVPAPRIPIFAKLTVFVVIAIVCSFAVRNADNKSTDVVHRSWCRTMKSMQWCSHPAYLFWWNWPFLLSLLLFVFALFLMPTTRVQMLSTGVDADRCNDARIPLLVLLYEVDDSFNFFLQQLQIEMVHTSTGPLSNLDRCPLMLIIFFTIIISIVCYFLSASFGVQDPILCQSSLLAIRPCIIAKYMAILIDL